MDISSNIRSSSKGFTLIELLIVVAIISILAGVAVPNLLEAQTRAKVARVKSDMRSLATASEAYMIDNGRYPYGQSFMVPSPFQKLRQVTTPIAYITSIPADPFNNGDNIISKLFPFEQADTYLYNSGVAGFALGGVQSADKYQAYSFTSVGPDREFKWVYFAFDDKYIQDESYIRNGFIYDPTNGTVSEGDIFRRGGYVSVNSPAIDVR